MDYTRRIWAFKGSSHGKAIKMVIPRISLIMAMDNYGEVYACMTQVNTDTKIMGLYIKELIKHLDAEDRNWRKHTILMHDGAKYAQSIAT